MDCAERNFDMLSMVIRRRKHVMRASRPLSLLYCLVWFYKTVITHNIITFSDHLKRFELFVCTSIRDVCMAFNVFLSLFFYLPKRWHIVIIITKLFVNSFSRQRRYYYAADPVVVVVVWRSYRLCVRMCDMFSSDDDELLCRRNNII